MMQCKVVFELFQKLHLQVSNLCNPIHDIIRPLLVESLVTVIFYMIFLMGNAVIINY